MFKKLLLSILCFSSFTPSFSQEMEVQGYFLDDCIKIGIGSPYVLTAKYKRGLDIVFPDSLYDYSPYELGEKWFATTQSTDEFSYDSAIYYLLSFEIDSTQYFNLPVYQLIGGDSILITTEKDSIFLTHMVSEIPDSIAVEAMPLVENTAYRYVSLALNYPYIAVGIATFIVVLVIVYVVFGKSIRKWFKLRTLRKNHEQFITNYQQKKASIKDASGLEQLLYIWKKYLEQLEKRPYTKMTTKELLKVEPFDRIENILKSMDRAIYGKYEVVENQLLEDIFTHAQGRFEDRLNEIKYA